MRRNLIILLIISIIAIGMTSCRTGRQAVGTRPAEWSSLSVPVKLRLNEPRRLSASGRVDMLRGQAINISVRMMGLEVAVAYIDADTVLIVDRYHQRFLASPFAPVAKATGLDITSLQDALIGYYTVLPEKRLFSVDADRASLELTYTPPEKTDGHPMAGSTNIVLSGPLDGSATITWRGEKAKWDVPLKIRPPETNGMEPLDLPESPDIDL